MGFKRVLSMVSLVLGIAVLVSYTGIPKILQKAKLLSQENLVKQGSFVMEGSRENRPTFLYKVLSMDDWAKSCETVHLSSADADFIHFSTEDQLSRIIEKYWVDVCEYIVLKIETIKLPGNLVLEANPGGMNKYYHLYDGSIPLSAIVESRVVRSKQPCHQTYKDVPS